jgi:hypothetical protein
VQRACAEAGDAAAIIGDDLVSRSSRLLSTLGVVLLMALAPACKQRDLRGTARPSPDGKTYLVIDDDKNGACPLELDGRPWTAKKGVAVPVMPGVHEIDCVGTKPGTSFEVHAGTTLRFDYWGP